MCSLLHHELWQHLDEVLGSNVLKSAKLFRQVSVDFLKRTQMTLLNCCGALQECRLDRYVQGIFSQEISDVGYRECGEAQLIEGLASSRSR